MKSIFNYIHFKPHKAHLCRNTGMFNLKKGLLYEPPIILLSLPSNFM